MSTSTEPAAPLTLLDNRLHLNWILNFTTLYHPVCITSTIAKTLNWSWFLFCFLLVLEYTAYKPLDKNDGALRFYKSSIFLDDSVDHWGQNTLQHQSSYTFSARKPELDQTLFLPATVSLCVGLHERIGLRQASGLNAVSESNDYSDIFWRGIAGQVPKCVLTNEEEFRKEEKLERSILCSGPSRRGCSEFEPVVLEIIFLVFWLAQSISLMGC